MASIEMPHEKIAELERDNSLLKAKLEERETLLREMHHRIKNNLQTVSSMLSLRLDRQASGAEKDLLLESQGRIRATALIHEKLSQSSDLRRIDFAEYSRELAAQLVRAFSRKKAIALKIDIKNIMLEIDKATCCGLIVNELVSNALKHGLEKREKGTIAITMRALKDSYVIAVSNDGEKLLQGFDLNNAGSLGMTIVRALAEQLGGKASVSTGTCTEFAIEFPKN